MTTVENVENEIRKMNAQELAEFRDWFLEFDSQQWDQQIEEDVRSGRLDKIAERALDSWRHDKTSEL